MQDSHPNLIVLKHSIICIFLIHSDSVEKLLTALIKVVWNIQKSTHFFFLSTKCKVFFNVEKVLVKITEEQS